MSKISTAAKAAPQPAEKSAAAPAAPAVPMAPVPQERRVQPIAYERWGVAGVFNQDHQVVLDPSTPYANVLRPEFWATIASKLKPGDRIEVKPDDLSFVATLRVWATGMNWAHVTEIAKEDRPAPSDIPASIDDLLIEFAGPLKKFRVVRKSDKVELKDRLETEEDARRWCLDYKRIIGRSSAA